MKDFMNMQYTFIGRKGNIGNTWFEAAQAIGLKFQRRSLPLTLLTTDRRKVLDIIWKK